MSKLYFKIGADYDKVIRLRDEIAKLRRELLSMNMVANPSNFSALERQLSRTTQEFDRLIQQAATAATQMQNTTININHTTSSLGGMNSMLAKIGGTVALSKLASDIIRVRGEFQAADTAIQTLLGSKEKADALMKQVREYAKISPLEFSDVTAATQMMLGFNIEAEKVPRFISAIGDVSMGEAQKFNSLTLAFSQMSATGKLMGQDLNQMINAGFNPLQQIAQTTGKSIATLKKEMSEGAISTEMVQKAFIDATSAGGKFYQMSENASKTINGQLSMIQDAMDAAFNEMGQKSEGIIMSGIQLTTSLIENYETIGKVLVGMIATYGVYKTALITNIALTRSWAVAARADATAKGIQAIATKAQTVAQLALNAAMKANPYVLAATLIVGVATAMWALHDSTTAAEKAQNKYNNEIDKFKQKEEERKQKIESLIRTIQDETETEFAKVKAYEELQRLSPTLTDAYKREELAVASLADTNKELNKARDIESYDNIIAKIKKYTEYVNRLKSAHTWNDLGDFRKPIKSEYGIGLISSKIEEAEADLVKWKNALEEYGRLKKRAEEDAKPVEVKILEAKNDRDQILQEFLSAKMTLEEEQRKIKDSGFGEIPIWVQIRFDNAKKALSNIDEIIKGLIGGQQSSVTYKEAYDTAKREWRTAQKALEESKKKSKTDYEAAKKNLDEKEKIFKGLGGNTDTSKQESAAEKRKKEAEKQKKEQQKSAEELLTLRRQNQQDEINLMKDGTEKKLKQIDLDYQKELDSIRKQESKWSKEQGGKLTQEQSIEISTRYTNAENKRDKDVTAVTKEQLKVEQQALNDYLKDYGTFQQQKLAIAQEYAEKIRKAQDESGVNSAQVKLLEKQRDVAIQSKETEAIKANIDWTTVFGEFGGMFNDMIKPTLEEAKKYIKTDEFKNSDQASQKSLIDAINQMEKSLGGIGGLNFKKLGQDVQVYQNSLRQLNYAKEEEINAIDKLKKVQKDYEKVLKSGTEEEKKAAKDALDTAQNNADAASSNVKTQTDIVNQNNQNLSDTSTKLRTNMNNVAEGLSKLASGGIKSSYDGLIQASKGMGGVIEKVADSLESVPIIGWILSIIDVFKDGLSNLVGGLLDAVFNAVGGIISDVISGDLFVTIGKSIASGVGNILNSISFGGFNSLFGIGGNAEETADKIDELTASNDALKTSIDDLKDEIAGTNGAKSIQAYNEAVNAQKRYEENLRKILDAQMNYNSAHHSNAYYWDLDKNSLSQINKLLGTNLNNTWGDFSKLTADQMNEIRTHLPDIWSEMINEGKYGDRFKDDWNKYADQAGQLQEMTDNLRENLAQISFDSLRDSFVDALMDMDAKAEDFADDFKEYMTRALLNFAVGDKMDENLKKWYESWTDTMNAQEGKLTEKQIEEYRRQWDAYVQEGMDIRDEITGLTGYTGNSSSSQSATSKGYQAMSQDTGEELNGRFTALQIAGEEIKTQNIAQTQSLNLLTARADAILSMNTETRNIADDTRNLIAQSYLELVQISENTGNSAKYLKDIKADIAEVKKNTSKL